MRKLTIKHEVDEATFQPTHKLYLDDIKTIVCFNIEDVMDAVAFHGKILLDDMPNILIQELKTLYNITDEEEVNYREIIGDIF